MRPCWAIVSRDGLASPKNVLRFAGAFVPDFGGFFWFKITHFQSLHTRGYVIVLVLWMSSGLFDQSVLTFRFLSQNRLRPVETRKLVAFLAISEGLYA